MTGRLFAIGDIHGCAAELEKLVGKLSPKRDDVVVFLGDYVDRGPASNRVVDIILDLSKRCNVVALKGNHESMFLDFLQRPESAGAGLFVLNGGAATLTNYAQDDGGIEIPDTHLKFFRELKLYYESDEFFFVHAGVPDIPLSEVNGVEHELHMLWSRYPFLGSEYPWEKVVVHGHTPVHAVEIQDNRINLDTGCVYDGKLTAMEFPSKKIYQVDRDRSFKYPATYPIEQDSSRISMRFSGRLAVKASRGDEKPRAYETLNYNQFGMLMKDAITTTDYALLNGDVLEGLIGDDPNTAIKFTGTVVRCEARGGFVVYGVRIDRIQNDSGGATGGPDWVERPQS